MKGNIKITFSGRKQDLKNLLAVFNKESILGIYKDMFKEILDLIYLPEDFSLANDYEQTTFFIGYEDYGNVDWFNKDIFLSIVAKESPKTKFNATFKTDEGTIYYYSENQQEYKSAFVSV